MIQGKDASRPAPYHDEEFALEPVLPLDVAALIRSLWHGKLLILCTVFLITGLAGFFAFRVVAPQYMATATLQLDHGGAVQGNGTQQDLDDVTLNTMIALATSDAVLSPIIAERGLMSDPEFNRYLRPNSPLSLRTLRTQTRHFLSGTTEQPPDAAAIHEKTLQNLRAVLSVSRQSESYILRITASSSDAAKATGLANATAAEFLTFRDAQIRQAQTEAEARLQARVTALRAQLEEQQMQAAALIATAQIQQGNGLDTLSAQILIADQNLIAAQNALAALEIAPDAGSARNVSETRQMRREINDIAAHKERLSGQLSTQSAGLAELHQIQMQSDATRQLYQTFLRQLHENRMQQGLNTPNAQRLTPATHATYVGPQKILILTIAALLGSALGVVIVALQHSMRKGAIDARSLRDTTRLPTLAQISNRTMRMIQKQRLALPGQPEVMQVAQELQTALFLATRGQPSKVILATSSMRGEGTASIAALLAQTLASPGKRVLFICADRSDQSIRKLISADIRAKAEENWCNIQSEALPTALGCDVLAVPANDGKTAFLMPDALSGKIGSLRASYDHIIIAGPPVLSGPQAQLWANVSDTVIYAVRWAKTPLHVVQHGLGALSEVDSQVSGLVLSQVNLRKMRKMSTDPCIGAMQGASVI